MIKLGVWDKRLIVIALAIAMTAILFSAWHSSVNGTTGLEGWDSRKGKSAVERYTGPVELREKR